MSESIKSRTNAIDAPGDGKEIKKLFDAVHTELTAVGALANELRTDHATTKTTVDAVETLIEELHDDAATQKTLNDELIADHATFKAVIDDLKGQINRVAGTNIITSGALTIGGTPTAVATGAFNYRVAGMTYAKAAVAAGTAPGNDVIPQNTFGAVALDIGADGTLDAIEATDNATGYASAALSAAGLPAVADGHARVGYVTATKSDGSFTFGTTALNAANTTVVYTNSATDVAVATSAPATLTATAPATLTAAKPASGPATLTAAAVVDTLIA